MRNKIRYFLSQKNHSLADYAKYLGIMPQSLNTKFVKNTLRLKDIQALANFTNTHLALVDENGKVLMDLTNDD